MKFTCFVDINLPIHEVIERFDNEENLKEWQDGFIGIEHIEGVKGEVGAKSNMTYKIGKKDMVLTETILVKNFPHEFTGLYEAKEMVNTMKNTFQPLSENQTRYSSEIEYTQFNGIMVKLMATLMPFIFKKQVQKWMNQFKAFAEGS